MKIKEAVYESCGECGRNKRTISEEEFGCDECRKPISFELKGKKHHDHLEVTVFRNDGSSSAEHLQFCSWKCVFKHLPKIKSDYFASLPYLQYESDVVPGQRMKDFLKLIKAKP